MIVLVLQALDAVDAKVKSDNLSKFCPDVKLLYFFFVSEKMSLLYMSRHSPLLNSLISRSIGA